MGKIREYQTSYLVAQKGNSFIVPCKTVAEGVRLLLSALRTQGENKVPEIVCTMVKRSVFLNGAERIIAQVPVPIKRKMVDKVLSSL